MKSSVKLARILSGLTGLFCVLVLSAGCNTLGGPGGMGAVANRGAIAPKAEEKGSSDFLRPGDAVVVSFSGVSDPPPRVEDRIREDGKIVLPFIGAIQASGMTRSQLQQAILKEYVPAYYKQLNVSVNQDIRYVYVYGEVNRRGAVPYTGQMTLLKAVAAAGDFTDFGNRRKVQLRRGSSKPVTINCEKALANSELDVAVYPEDIIYVPRRIFF